MSAELTNTTPENFSSNWPDEPFGTPIPNNPHSVSVWMPNWQNVVDYEEGVPEALATMQSGYPRFFFNKFYDALCESYNDLINTDEQFVRVFPSEKVAKKGFNFAGCGEIISDRDGVYACAFPKDAEDKVKLYWQHAGPFVSSRQAEDILNGVNAPDGTEAKQTITDKLCSLYEGVQADDVKLYPIGMAAIFAAYEAAQDLKPGAKTIQLGFPYLDTLKIQERFGPGCFYIAYDDLEELERVISSNEIAAVFTEAPTNPLLDTADFDAAKAILDRHNVPLIVDDTVGTAVNLDVMPYADIVVTSLTKFFCGSGLVCGGSLVLNPRSDFYGSFKSWMADHYEDLLYAKDAVELAKTSQTFETRVQAISTNAEALADYLKAHDLVKDVYYPKFRSQEQYNKLKRTGSGYSGLLSVTLKDSSQTPAFHDHLKVHKGPSLGTDFTLACPYVLLAHYGELDEVEARGVSRHLIRISVGTENIDDLIQRFDAAFAACQ